MCHFLLAKADPCVAKADIFTIVFVRILEIALALHIIAFAFTEKKGIFQVSHIGFHGIGSDLVFALQLLHGVDRVCHIIRICKRTYRRTEQIQKVRQNVDTSDFFPLYDVFDIYFSK